MRWIKQHWFLLFILPITWILSVAATLDKSATFDEGIHLTSGLSYWTRRDFRLHPENGNLPQRLAGLPLWLSDYSLPAIPSAAWFQSDKWTLAKEFLYSSGVSPSEVLRRVHAAMALFALALVGLVYGLGRHYFGKRAAYLSTTLFAFSPMILGHGPLATSDVMISFFLIAYLCAQWRFLQRPTWARGSISGLLLGLLLLSKMSAIVALPMTGLLVASRFVFRRTKPFLFSKTVFGLAVQSIIAFVMIWAAYDFRFSRFAPESPGEPAVAWEETAKGLGLGGDVIQLARKYRVLPDAYLYGMAYALNFTVRPAYLAGEVSDRGWWYYFPTAFVLKNSPLFLLSLLLGAAYFFRHLRRRLYEFTPVVLLVLVYSALALRSTMNIGERHLFPIYPALFLFSGASVRWFRGRSSQWLAPALGICLSVETALIFPNYLTYFTPLVGGPEHGSKFLVDSSLDWGQDLPALKKWIDSDRRSYKGSVYYLSYFGTASPRAHGISAQALPSFFNDLGLPRARKLRPGTYCISATMRAAVLSSYPGTWNERYEKIFQARSRNGENIEIEFARLLHYLRDRKADAQVGNSIYVYRLNADELDRALAVTSGQELASLTHVGVNRNVLLTKRTFGFGP